MKVACLQMDMLLGKPQENFSHAAELVAKAMADRPDVLVLPETWNTGFFPKENLPSLCDRDGEQTRQVLRRYPAEEFARAWLLNKRGAAYLVRKK